jgi:sugar phosphate isomerase/epimerase
MSRAIVGYSGFVGSNLLQFYKFTHFYNSKNFKDAANLEFDELFFCGIPAVKWYANKNPEEDSVILNDIKNILKTIVVKKLIFISTIDVYEYTDSQQNESYDCDFMNTHAYGRNRVLFEEFVKTTFCNYHIIRLPALFGKGLKKNIIYDLIYNNQIENISKDTSFQWYDLNWLQKDIDIIVKNNIPICNLFTEPLSTFDIIQLFAYPIENFTNKSKLVYNVQTKYSHLFESSINGYIRDKFTVLHNLKTFIYFNKIDKSRLVVSNICIKSISQFQFACILRLFGIKYVQIAPTTLMHDWDQLEHIKFDTFINNGLQVYSFQSITYGLHTLNIFEPTTARLLMSHLKKVIDVGIKHKIKVFVFGCPKNRRILDINNAENDEIFCEFFRELGDYVGNADLTICIEPNSKQYDCNYINTIEEAGKLVERINHTNIKMMVDIGNAMMENDNLENIYKYKNVICNVDVAQKKMDNFTVVKENHLQFMTILKNANYCNKINLEMLLCDEECELDHLCKSLHNFIQIVAS